MTEGRIKLRPFIPSLKITSDMSAEEVFQNQTLRPIIKMQHDLLMTHFQHYLISKKCSFADLLDKERVTLISAAFSKDLQFRNTIQGMILGQFTTEEYIEYSNMVSDTNKRITQIVKERILSSLDELLAMS